MNSLAKQVFLIEIDHQCDYAIYAGQGMQSALDNHEPMTFWFYSQSLLTSAANISKLLWGSSEKRTELRKMLGINNSSVLKSKYIRNCFEHFDEKLEEWSNNAEIFIDSNIGPKDMIAGIKPKDHLRFFDTDDVSIKFKGASFKVKPIFIAIHELKDAVQVQLKKIMMQDTE